MWTFNRPRPIELWAMSAILLVFAFLVSPGFYTIDEAIYFLGARAVAEHGTFAISGNGYDLFHSESLKLRFLVNGPHGLTPQYPAGTALTAGILLPLLGPRAFILLNVVASIACLFTIRRICLDQFKNENISRIAIGLLLAGSFWLEYAVGLWPHVVSAFCALQAYWFAVQHLSRGDRRAAAISGAFAAAGILFRLDAILAAPAIGLIIILYADRPIRSSCWFALGALPPLGLMSALNYLKFGTANPVSYGQPGGFTDLAAYGGLIAALCCGLGLVLLLRKAGWSISRKALALMAAMLLVALLTLPSARAALLQLWQGFVALVVDLRLIDDGRLGVEPGPGNTVSFLGLAKKALGQSIPWMAIIAILLTRKVEADERRTVVTLLIFIGAFAMPFIWLSWHGGGGGNMRYFLPMLPAICILCAKLFYDLSRSVSGTLIFLAAGVWAAVGLGLAWVTMHPSGYAGLQQIAATYIFLATALVAIAAGFDWAFAKLSRQLAVLLFAVGFLMSMSFATSDFRGSQKWRSTAHAVNETVARLPSKSLVIAPPEWVARAIPGDGSIASHRDVNSGEIDKRLVVEALDAGYRVFVTSGSFAPRRDLPMGVTFLPTPFAYPGGRLLELRLAAESRPENG